MSGHSDRWCLDDVAARLLRNGEWFLINPETVNAEYVELFGLIASKARTDGLQLFRAGKGPRSRAKNKDDARDGMILYLWMRGVKLDAIATYVNGLKKYNPLDEDRVRKHLTRARARWRNRWQIQNLNLKLPKKHKLDRI